MTPPAPPSRGQRRPDASMDLLNDIVRQPVDPDYAAAAARGLPPRRLRWDLAVVAVLIGILFTMAAQQTTRSAPAQETERAELIDRIQQAEAEQDRLRVQVGDLTAEINRMRTEALGDGEAARTLIAQLAALDPLVGAAAVRGPGLVIVVDDAPSDSGESPDRVLDLDLQVLATGLWSAGAEAIAINGHRLSSLTAIRGAGDAITVDYRSLTRPYRVEAIGDPRALPARWVESAGGTWWNELAQNRRMRYDMEAADELLLPADPGMRLRYARRGDS